MNTRRMAIIALLRKKRGTYPNHTKIKNKRDRQLAEKVNCQKEKENK